jgi:2-polyprenyl-6-methoxyphenol hydroxylase-like FAD-dependent oxidoreductase
MRRRILIVGAGIAGLALARALRLEGLAPEIVERAGSWPTAGAGLYIPGNGARALRMLGLADEVLNRGVRIHRQRFLDRKGRRLAEIELPQVWGPIGPCLGIARRELHRILLDGAAVPIRLGTTVTAVNQEEATVDVVFDGGSSGSYDLVVGADGIHSSIRQLAFGGPCPRHLGLVSWRFVVDSAEPGDAWTAMLDRRRAFLRVPIGPDCVYCYADIESASPEDPAHHDLNRFRALFADFAEPVPGILREVRHLDSIYFSPIEEVRMATGVQGRVALIGDAAHVTSPNMAEGASMALEDALVLTRMLVAHGSTVEALSAFAERRRARVEWVRQRSHRRDRIRSLPDHLRNLALRAAGRALYRRDYEPLFEDP